MKLVRVQYTVKDEFVETNKTNIRAVMNDLKALGNPGIKYSTFQLEDGNSFMHLGLYPDDETAKLVGERETFQKFRSELKASEPISPPKAENLSLVGSAYELFE